MTIVEFLINELNSIDKKVDHDLVLALLARGDFLFLLDGYDEIASSDRDKVVPLIQDFVSKAGGNKFVLTSRSEPSLTAFSEFHNFNIRKMTKDEAYNLIRKYDYSGEISEQLIEKLEDPQLKPVHEFLVNPLLTSLLFRAYGYKQTVPVKKPDFYRQVYDALYNFHDSTKEGPYNREKKCRLEIEEFHRVLRVLGFISMRSGKVEYSKDELISLLRKTKDFTIGLSYTESSFLDDLIYAVPLFVVDGLSYRWSHKSLQDYFAASFISADTKENQREILLTMLSSTRVHSYGNVLDIFYDLDIRAFRHIIVYHVVKEYIEYFENSHQEFEDSNIDREAISRRKAINFLADALVMSEETTKVLRISSTRATSDESIGSDLKKYGFPLRDHYIISAIHFAPPLRVVMATGGFSVVVGILAQKPERMATTDKTPYNAKAISEALNWDNMIYGEDCLLTDKISCKLNAPDIFEKVTIFLSVLKRETLDYRKCVKLKKEIEKEIEIVTKATSMIFDL